MSVDAVAVSRCADTIRGAVRNTKPNDEPVRRKIAKADCIVLQRPDLTGDLLTSWVVRYKGHTVSAVTKRCDPEFATGAATQAWAACAETACAVRAIVEEVRKHG